MLEQLSIDVLKEIGNSFPADAQCDRFLCGPTGKGNLISGSFAATLSDHHAALAKKFRNFLVVEIGGDALYFGNKRTREYLICVVGVTCHDTKLISLRENVPGTIVARELIAIRPLRNVPYYNLVVLVPRIGSTRESMIGIAVAKGLDGTITIEFKRDGRVLPALN